MTTQELREKLIDYVGTAAFSGMPMAFIELAEIENADDEELIKIAQQLGLNETISET